VWYCLLKMTSVVYPLPDSVYPGLCLFSDDTGGFVQFDDRAGDKETFVVSNTPPLGQPSDPRVFELALKVRF